MSDLRSRYGSWAVVTGASSGIGLAFAEALARQGLKLVLVARREAALADLAGRLGVETRIVPADLGTEAGLAAVEQATADLEVGLLVASAGFGTSGPFAEADLDAEVAMLDVNVRAVLRQAHHFGQRFAARGRGGIVLLGSLVGFQGTPFAAHYAATKAYVQTLGEALCVELAPRGVDVVVSAPGPVRTGFAEAADMEMGAALAPEAVVGPTLAGLGRRQTVRPGWLTKVLGAGLATVPRWGKVRIMERVMGGMTAHQRTPAP
ncbi:MAG: SDR family NAD(P)-dependent oxidoreductase [Bacteroidota bacterium]